MKSEGAIRHKLRQVRFRYLKQRISAAMARRPTNCIHNGVVDTKPESVRICFNQIDIPNRKVVVCDDRFDGCARAETCAAFALKNTKAAVKTEFYAELEGMTFPEIAYHYPDMAALLWVLAEENLAVPKPDPHEFDLSDQPVEAGVASTAPSSPSTMTQNEAPVLTVTSLVETNPSPVGPPIDEGIEGWTSPAHALVRVEEDTPPSPKPFSWIDRMLGRGRP